jgi:hypothetical protein
MQLQKYGKEVEFSSNVQQTWCLVVLAKMETKERYVTTVEEEEGW